MSHLIYQQVDGFFGSHFSEMKIEGKNDPGCTVRAPEESTDLVFGRFVETHVPKQKLPVECPTFGPKRRAEERSVRPVTSCHELLQMVAGNKLMMRDRPREMWVVSSERHHLLLVCHAVGRIGNKDRFPAEEEGSDKLPFGRHHLHPPSVFCELRNGDELVLFDIVDRFAGEIANKFGLLSRFDVFLLDGLDRLH